ncbi:MAG TPA: metallopeptidase family protein [Candidatus Paceibacterota bacterium]|nr:metallopeptidase family protein [Candidatus Paceibacterota bacterium]
MDSEAFSKLAYEMWDNVPSPYKERIVNVALLVEDAPTDAELVEEGVEEGTLLGIYRGIPNTERGEGYGIGMTLPDTITLYRLPILDEAREDLHGEETFDEAIRRVTAETLWHEVGHYFGLTEEEIHQREKEGTNAFKGGQGSSSGI